MKPRNRPPHQRSPEGTQRSPHPINETRPIPRDTAAAIQGVKDLKQNFGLILDRFASWRPETPWSLGNDSKVKFTEKDQGKMIFSFDLDAHKSLLSAHQRRWKKILEHYANTGYRISHFQLHSATRVIVGLGADSVLETNIRLHRVYGFPIIPASALKGVCRAYAKLIDGRADDDEEFTEVFGKPPPDAAAGKVIFFDAIPADPNALRLELDVMNPHYSSYYQGNDAPADYLNPVPIFFLTIAPCQPFLFAVAGKDDRLAQLAQTWLQEALQNMGIGAKTTSGYGLWR
ncbi:MAG: type III-B CRISPR module RAMP protein Cmr6 [Armatimonadetes bacterium]|nr:type III-B CRISPR module RAMP protein Cmr6 [Armatimonadota bacterium]MDW8121931.1 type III-B CRISPR module RAMP protein Cmr6 [Armatimonadota bacterium]